MHVEEGKACSLVMKKKLSYYTFNRTKKFG
jgi:hypothetical protein